MPQTEIHTGTEHPKTDRIAIRKDSNGNYKTIEDSSPSVSLYAATIPANTKVVSEEYAKAVTGDLTKLDSPSNHISTIIIDQSYTVDPLHVLVTGDIAVEKDSNGDVIYRDGVPVTKSPDVNVISWIREHTKLVHAKYNHKLKVLSIIEKDASKYGDDEVPNIGIILPKFWWKSTMIDDNHCKVDFCHEEKYVDDSWHCWEGNTYIDSYKIGIDGIYLLADAQQKLSWFTYWESSDKENRPSSTIINTDVSANVKDISSAKYRLGVVQISYNEFKDIIKSVYDNNCFSMVTYESHKIMALLFYAFYGDVNIQKICGASSEMVAPFAKDDNPIIRDIHKDSVPSDVTTVFWGLANWYGKLDEFVDNLVILSNHGSVGNSYYGDYKYAEVGVLDYEGNIKRIIRTVNYDEGSTKMILGENFDLLPRIDSLPPTELGEKIDDAYSVAWADDARAGGAPGSVAFRGGVMSNSSGGVAFLGVYFGADDFNWKVGSRLQYTGQMVEVDSFEQVEH